MLFWPQNPPLGKGFEQAFCDRERGEFRGVGPARVGRVIARPQRPPDHGGRVIPDVDDAAAQPRPLHAAEQPSGLYHEARFLLHLPDQRFRIRLAWLDPPAGQRPQPRPRLMPALDQQQPSLSVLDDGTYARDKRARHAVKYRYWPSAPASVVRCSAVTFVTGVRMSLKSCDLVTPDNSL